MSFVCRGTRGDIETGFPGFIPERRAVRIHAPRPVNTNSLAFLVTGTCSSLVHDIELTPNVTKLPALASTWCVFDGASLRMYATCQQLQAQAQAQAQANAVAASGLLGHTELRLQMPPSIALATRGRLQGLRLQLALLDREFDDLDYETLRALDTDNAPTANSMSEEEVNSLPIHKYKVANSKSGGSLAEQGSSSATPEKVETGGGKTSEDELTCSVCLEQVNVGELVRSLPCLHQFHASCIDPWLRQQGTCPVCKFRVGSAWQYNEEDEEMDGSLRV